MEVAIMPIVTSDNKVGRPLKYETHVLPRIKEVYEWLCNGYTDYSICDNLGISHQTWIDYKKTQVELIEAYTRARTHKNSLVMNAQFSKAVGIDKTVPKAFKIKEIEYDEKGKKISEKERLEYGEEHVYIPPDVNAADLYLRNNSDDYKSARADTGAITLNINNTQLPELQAQLKAIDDKLKELDAIEVECREIE